MDRDESPKVLVVGGALVGLSAGMFLAHHGVRTVLVDKHPGSALHPRAIGFFPRTMEVYRSVGLDGRVPQVPRGWKQQPRRMRVASLDGEWYGEVEWTPDDDDASDAEPGGTPGAEFSPCTLGMLAQDSLEPILRQRAIELGVDVRVSTELTSFVQDADGVTATLRPRDGDPYDLRVAFVIGADGHASPVRHMLGIGRSGLGHIRTVRSVLFRAPLDEYQESGISQFDIDQPGMGMMVSYRDGRWVLLFDDDDERDEATLLRDIHSAIGRTDVPVEIITSGRWEIGALIADTFRDGRVFLAGDAAHTLPPARGGYGANTGIEDAHNLAWKLKSVVSGVSTPALLDSYDAERRPIAWLRHGQIFNRPDYAEVARPDDQLIPRINDDAMELGQLYRSAAVLGASDDLPPAKRPDEWAGQPGTRAPHLWLAGDGQRRSTLDLFGRGWVLLADDRRWTRAAAKATSRLGVDVGCVQIATLKPYIDPGVMAMSLDASIMSIVSNPAGKDVLETHVPGITTHSRYEQFKVMSLRELRSVAADELTPEALEKIASDLKPLQAGAKVSPLELPISMLLAQEAGRVSLERHLPEVLAHPRFDDIKSMGLRALQVVAPDRASDAQLAEVEADLRSTFDVSAAAPAADDGPRDPDEFRAAVRKAFGISGSGASLVRPDGYVAWRSPALSWGHAGRLTDALRQLAATTK